MTHPLRRTLGLLLGLALVMSGLLVATSTSRASADTSSITSGSLTWSVKDTWRRYIGEQTTVGDGATITGWSPHPGGGNIPDGFNFPVASGSYDPETATTELTLKGYVHFQAWYGQVTPGKYALDTKFSDLRIVISPTQQVLRGTHTGYLRSDPGGQLHEDVDVVLATFDVKGATVTTGPPTTTWSDVPTVAGPGFSIYGEGTVIDDTSFTYEGPGGIPDTGEKLATQGAPVLSAGPTWSTGSDAFWTNGGARQLLASGDGKRLFAFTRATAGEPTVVTAIDAATMKSVGQPYTVTDRDPSGSLLRLAIDPATDTIFYLTGFDGSAVEGNEQGQGVENTVRSLTFDGSTFTAGVVGRLRDSTLVGSNVPTLATSALVWNGTKKELFVAAAIAATERPDRWTTDDVYRFTRDGDGWTRSTSRFSTPTTGDFANATGNVASPLSGTSLFRNNVGVLGDGSYVVASGAAQIWRETAAPRTRHYAPSLHLSFDTDGTPTTSEIGGTILPTVYGTYYGYTSAETRRDGSVVLHGDGQSQEDFAPVTLVDGSAVKGTPVIGTDRFEPNGYSVLGTSVAEDLATGGLWVVDTADDKGQQLHWYQGTKDVSGYAIRSFSDNYFGNWEIHALPDGSVVVPVKSQETGEYGYQRLENAGLAPKVTSQPEATTVTVAAGSTSASASFSTAVDTAIGGTVQWQRKRVGETSFSDLGGQTSATLSLDVTPADDGATFRAKVTNDAGTVASDEAVLTVRSAPIILEQPHDAKVAPGVSQAFSTLWTANPDATVTWQRKVGGFWTSITADDDSFAVGDGTLTLKESDVAQSGTQLRAKLVNAVGTTYTRAATLTVTSPAPAGPGTITGAVLRWTGSEEMQKAPPAGGSSYFSAGVSDGTQSTYRATSGHASVVHVDGDEKTAASWATRAAMVDSNPDTAQVVQLDGGTGTRTADGTVKIAWDAAWTVNFYGGLVPFTITDPHLTIAPDGSGTLRGDLSGYGSSQANPGQKDPVAPVEDVVISTFDGAGFDPDGFTIDVDYAGVEVTAPSGASAQLRTGEHWGAWPQQFVDFHGKTGLSSYWYSSGGAADPYKAAAPIVVGSLDLAPGEPVATKPVITTQPSSVKATVRTKARFAVAASGQDVGYQWQRRVGSSWLDLPDERAAALAFSKVTTADHGAAFRVKVSNGGGSATSRAVSLSVVPATVSAKLTTSRTTQKYKAATSRRALLTLTLRTSNGTTPRGTVTFYRGSKKVATTKVTSTGTARYRLRLATPRGKHRFTAVFKPSSTKEQSAARASRTVRVR